MIYPDELDIFAAFKRAGLIPRQAQRRHYAIHYRQTGCALWRVGIRRRGSYYLYERMIGELPRGRVLHESPE